MDDIKGKIHEYVSKNKFIDALEYIGSKVNDEKLRDNITLLSGRYYKLKEDKIRGIISHEDATLEWNKIGESIIFLGKELERIKSESSSSPIQNTTVSKPPNDELNILNYNSESDGLFKIVDWNYLKTNTGLNPKINYSPIEASPNPFDFIQMNEFRTLGEKEYLKYDENIYTYFITDVKLPSPQEDSLIINICPSPIRNQYITVNYLKERVDIHSKLLSRIMAPPSGVIDYLSFALPTECHIVTTILNEDGNELFIMKRKSYPDFWVTGTYRSIVSKYEDVDSITGNNYSLFDLINNNLSNIGLEKSDYSKPFISWIGLLARNMRFHIVSTVRLNISNSEFEKKFRQSYDFVERNKYNECSWMKFNEGNVAKFFAEFNESKLILYTEKDYNYINEERWLSNSALNLKYTWEVRELLTND